MGWATSSGVYILACMGCRAAGCSIQLQVVQYNFHPLASHRTGWQLSSTQAVQTARAAPEQQHCPPHSQLNSTKSVYMHSNTATSAGSVRVAQQRGGTMRTWLVGRWGGMGARRTQLQPRHTIRTRRAALPECHCTSSSAPACL